MEEETPAPQGPGADRSRSIMRGLGSLTIQNVLSAVLGFVLTTSLLRFLPQAPQSEYGVYSSVSVTIGIAGVFSTFGLGAAVVRFLAPGASEAEGSGWGAAKASLYLIVGLSAVASVAIAALAPFLSDYFAKDPTFAWVFYFGAALLFTSSVAGAFQSMLQGMRRYSFLAKVLLGGRAVSVAIAVAGLVLYQSLAVALAALIVYSGLVLVLAVPVVIGPLRRADAGPHYLRVMRYAYLLGVASVVGTIAGTADIVVVGGYLSLGSLGVYNAAVTVSSFLSLFFVAPLVTALFAETSYSSESEDEVRLGTALALRFSLMTLLPASFFAAAMAPQLFGLFSGGGAYAQGIPYLELITVFYLFAGVQSIAASILQGVGRTKEVLVMGAVMALVEVAMAVSLVPGLGLAGAAYSRVAMFIVGCALSLYFLRRYLPRADHRFYAKVVVASVVPALVAYVPSTLVSDSLVTIAPYTLAGVAAFAVCAKLLKLLSGEDRSYLEHLLPPGLHWIIRLF